MSGKLFVITAPSGAGKTSLIDAVMRDDPSLKISVSYTTRAPRKGEKDGVDYHFVSKDRFQKMIAEGAFVEWAHVHGHDYGTPRTSIAAAKGLVVFDIDVQGGQNIKKQHPEAVRALILPPSLAELERRLRARSTDDEAAVRRRLHAARLEIGLATSAGYEYWVVNDDLERAYQDLEAIVRAEECRAGRRPLAPDLTR